MNSKTVAILAAGAALGATVGPTLAQGTPAREASNHTVVLIHNQYQPGTVSIRRGDTVTWLWRDGGTLHNVIASSFRSRTMTHGSFAVRFTRAGTFNYKCTVHPHMSGRVIVH